MPVVPTGATAEHEHLTEGQIAKNEFVDKIKAWH